MNEERLTVAMTMKTIFSILFFFAFSGLLYAQNIEDTIVADKQYSLDEVVVTGVREETDIRHLPMSISVVNSQQISKRYEQSLLPILAEQVPGLFVTGRGVMGYGVSTGAAGVMTLRGIGGSPTTGLLVLIDGHPQYMGLMGHSIADVYQSMLAEKVEVLRGPASVLYGSNAMGGVINIVTPKQQEEGMRNNIRAGYGTDNTVITEGSSRFRKGKFSSIITASYNRTDGHRKDIGFEQYGGYVKLGYDISNTWKVFTDLNITHFNASNPGMVSTPVFDNDSRVTRGMTSFSLENKYQKTSGAFKLFYNWGRHKINEGYREGQNPPDYRFNSKDLMAGITWYQSATLFNGNRVTAGVDYQHFGGEAWNQFTDKRAGIADKTADEVAGYINLRQAIGNLLTLDIGIRTDHHSQTGAEWIPQGGLALQLRPSAELKAMISKGFRNPSIRELYMFGPQNPDLLPEKLMSYEISYSHRLLENTLSYGLNFFYINGNNIIQTAQINGQPLNVNTGTIENWGAEAYISYKINPSWRIAANYSWLKMVHPVTAAPEHKLYAGGDFAKGKWTASTGLQYINGLYTSVYPNPIAKENFLLWNLRGSYRLHTVVELFIRGENLLAQQYEINAGYPMPGITVIGGFNFTF